MSIMDKIFGQRQPQQVATTQQQPQVATTGAPASLNVQPGGAPEANSVTAPNGVVPSGSGGTPEKSPMEAFKDLWQPPVDKDGKPIQQTNNDEPLFNIDQAKIREAAGKMDFSKVLKPEQIQAIAKGGEEAMQAFAQAMNAVSQEVFANAMMASTSIMESGISKARDKFNKEIPQHIRSQNSAEALKASNPIFSNPAASMMVEGVRKQLELKFPQATSQELAALANDYFNSFATTFTAPSRQAEEQKNKTEAFDWDKWASQ